jgi:hypothetical protein
VIALSPWSLARRTAAARRAVLWLLLAALLFGFGMHAARACVPGVPAAAHHAAGGSPCHGEPDIDLAEAACEAHCRTDIQSGRASPSFDLPPAAPADLSASMAPPPPVGPLTVAHAEPCRGTGPPLHILLHRLLR